MRHSRESNTFALMQYASLFVVTDYMPTQFPSRNAKILQEKQNSYFRFLLAVARDSNERCTKISKYRTYSQCTSQTQ